MQRSAFCRSRRKLSNEYFLAKFGFDTAENEHRKVCDVGACRVSCSLSSGYPAGLARRSSARRPGPSTCRRKPRAWTSSSSPSSPTRARRQPRSRSHDFEVDIIGDIFDMIYFNGSVCLAQIDDFSRPKNTLLAHTCICDSFSAR